MYSYAHAVLCDRDCEVCYAAGAMFTEASLTGGRNRAGLNDWVHEKASAAKAS